MRYDYRCEKCGVFEVEKKMADPAPEECPQCGGRVERHFGTDAAPMIMYANRPPWTYKEALKYKEAGFKGGPKFKIDPNKHGDIGSWNSPGELVKPAPRRRPRIRRTINGSPM